MFPWTTTLNRERRILERKRSSGFICCSVGLLHGGIAVTQQWNFEASLKFVPPLVFLSLHPIFTSAMASSNSGNKSESDRNRWQLLCPPVGQAILQSTLWVPILLNLLTLLWVGWCSALHFGRWEEWDVERVSNSSRLHRRSWSLDLNSGGQTLNPDFRSSSGAWSLPLFSLAFVSIL